MAGNVQVIYQNEPMQKGPRPVKAVKKQKTFYDFGLLLGLVVIFAIGLLIIFSSSQYTAMIEEGNARFYLTKQLKFGLVGLAACIGISKLDYRWLSLRITALTAYAGSVAVLLVTLVAGLASHGKTRWLSIGGRSFQPTEVAKIGLIIFMAYFLRKHARSISEKKTFLKALILAVIPAGIVFSQNLSSGIIMIFIAGIMLFVAAKNYVFFGSVAAIGIAGYVSAKPVVRALYRHNPQKYLDTGHYWLRRILAWALPEEFSNDAYQTKQGLYAIGSGGMTGRGLGESIQKFGKIPEVQNDMIFTVICEEFGFVGAVLIVLLYFFLIYRIYMIAKNTPDYFGSLLCIGVMAHLSIQVILNIAVVTGVIPNTGVTLPFISYGGTALMCTMTEIGIVLSVANRIPIAEE